MNAISQAGTLYRNHYQGALARILSCLLMWGFAYLAYLSHLIRVNNITGISIAVMFLIVMNPPALFLLKRIKGRYLSEFFSIFINLLEIAGYTAIIYFLGGIRALWLTPIFAVLIFYVGLVSPRRYPFVIASLCGAAVFIVVLLEYLGIIPGQYPLPALPMPLNAQMGIVLAITCYLQIVALVSSYSGGLIRKNKSNLKSRNADLEEKTRQLKDTSKKLQIVNLELDNRVKERTRDLEDINRKLQKEIDERKSAEAAHQKSEEKYRSIIESIEDGYYEVDTEGTFTFLNSSLCRILGHSGPDELLGVNNRAYMDKENAGKVFHTFNRVFTTGESTRVFDWQLIKKDGSKCEVDTSVSLIRDANGKAKGFRGIVHDITERKSYEKALRQSEEKYRSFVQNFKGIAFKAALDTWTMIFCHGEVEEITGYSEDEFVDGRPRWSQIIFPQDLEGLPGKEEISCLPHYSTRRDYRIIRKDGNIKWVHEISRNICDESGKPVEVEGTIIDITGRKQVEEEKAKLETQYRQAQRMEAIGTLAGGIAHNFNNVLMGIQGRASLMLMDRGVSHQNYEHLKCIEEYVHHATELTKNLLGFARGGQYESRPIDLNALIDKETEMFGRTRKEIRIHAKYEKDLWCVEGDQGQIWHMLMNLYVNAWQAMPGGGDLFVQTENVFIRKEDTRLFGSASGRYVKISVTDTGVGMDEETRQKIFDPFFTTQEIGKGTGLGLSSVYGIVRSHKGFIRVYSEKGKGAAFNIFLPASEAEVTAEKPVTDPRKAQLGEETLLLVDDEKMIIDVGEQLLKSLGYRVLTAGSGKEAISVYEKSKDAIDLVILDMIMPEMGGRETYARLKEIDPDVKVMLSTGYSIEGEAKEIMDQGCDGFIQKPFNIERLSQEIRKILGVDVN